MDQMPDSFKKQSLTDVLDWLRRESIFFDAARKEWEAHAAEYGSGIFGLKEFQEQVQ